MSTIKASNTNELSRFIASKRQEAGLTPKQLAERSGLSPAYISRIEKGDYESPSLPSLKALADGLGLTLRAFLQDAGLLNNDDRPSFKLITQALRQMGYSDTAAEDVIRYARYVKERRNK